jgi:geranylgeranyl diphosphate synthase, type II
MTDTEQASLEEYLTQQQQLIDRALDAAVPTETQDPTSLHKAMRYSLFAGGKRIRPILVIAAAQTVSHSLDGVEGAAAAVELIHTYSLIHDDLPAMDNDDLRRGRPTCHKVFGEAIAILAGDALCTFAFELMARLSDVESDRKIRMIEELARASGTVGGMIAGQVHDIEGERQVPSAPLLDKIHKAKTGALLRGSVRIGALYGGATPGELETLSNYGEHVGLAFQIVDDILDVEQTSEKLGKTAGKDEAQEKITFPAVYGLSRSREMAEEQRVAAHRALQRFDDRADRLRQLADFIVRRRA